MKREAPSSANQPATSQQRRDSDQRRIWRECLHEGKCLVSGSVSVPIFSLRVHHSSVFPLLLTQMLPGDDGIKGIVP